MSRSEHVMTDPGPSDPGTHQRPASTTPTITAAGGVITGAGFLPDQEVTVRISYIAEDISDYLTYTTDPRGNLHAELPTSPGAGALHITATDHRTDPDGVCGLLWSNTQTVWAPTGPG
jgi:hypothetical protein